MGNYSVLLLEVSGGRPLRRCGRGAGWSGKKAAMLGGWSEAHYRPQMGRVYKTCEDREGWMRG